MLAISIILIVWFGFWLFFAWQKHSMLSIITCIMIDQENDGEHNGTKQKYNED